VLNHRFYLFEINMVIENHPSIARAAALMHIPRKKYLFYGGASPCFTVILTTINLDYSL